MAALSAAIVPSRVLGQDAPSNKLNLAAIGIGGMGASNLKACAGENIVALCDVDRAYAAKVIAAYPKAKFYVDYREMLEKETGIDGVIIATPDHTHAAITMAVLRAGKHVLLPEAADAHGLRGPRGHRGGPPSTRSSRRWATRASPTNSMRLLKEWLDDGAIGNVTEVHAWTDRPVGGDPWSDFEVRARPKDTPPVPEDARLGPVARAGRLPAVPPGLSPVEVARVAGLRHRCARRHGVPHPRSRFLGARARTAVDGRGDLHALRAGRGLRDLSARMHRPLHVPGARQPASGEAHLDRRTPAAAAAARARAGPQAARQRRVAHRRQGDHPARLTRRRRRAADPRDADAGVYAAAADAAPRVKGTHEGDWIRAIKEGPKGVPPSSPFEYGGALTEMVLLGVLAIRMKDQRLEWDSKNLRFTNNEQANALLKIQYREGWTL